MSVCSDFQTALSDSDSFWEPGHFRRTTRRIENGYKLCTDLQNLINERADIERSYARSLQNWAKKWGDLIDKGPEYGSMVAAWKSILIEAERISQIHSTIKDNLCDNEIQQVKMFQKDNYRKSMLQLKERKEIEDEFKKVQKPWIKHLTNVDKLKTEYHEAFKNEKMTLIQEQISSGDSSLSQDQIKKIQDRALKAREELPKRREKYEEALAAVDQYSPTYVNEMTSVFVKCQEMEKIRKQFVKRVLISMQKTLNITQYSDLQQIYDEVHDAIHPIDPEQDLTWWSIHHGVDTPFSGPIFVACTAEDATSTQSST